MEDVLCLLAYVDFQMGCQRLIECDQHSLTFAPAPAPACRPAFAIEFDPGWKHKINDGLE